MLQRAKWAVEKIDQDTGEVTFGDKEAYQKWDNENGQFIKCNGYEDFKEKYLKLSQKSDIMVLREPTQSDDVHYNNCIEMFKKAGVKYNPVEEQSESLTEESIIKLLAGDDQTSGSCASVGMAYIGQKHGMDVLDFRGSESMKTFRSWEQLQELTQMKDMTVLRASGASSLTVGNRLLKQVEVGKEYYLVTGKHAAVVRKTSDDVLQYLELQSKDGGWKDFNGNPKYTLGWRFGCNNQSNPWHEKLDFMVDISDSAFDTDEFKSILGYINTNVDEQMKGIGGGIK